MKIVLPRNGKLEQLEKELRWCETINYLETLWRQKSCMDSILRLMTQTWFLISDLYQLSPYQEHFSTLEDPPQRYNDWLKLLRNTVEIGDKEYDCEPVYLAVSGHLMVVHPEWFVHEGHGYDEVLREGKERLSAAQRNMPELRVFSSQARISPADKKLAEQMFPGYSEVDEYFKCFVMGG